MREWSILSILLLMLLVIEAKSIDTKELSGEGGFLAGAGNYGTSLGLELRYYQLGASLMITKMYESDISYDKEDVEPPDANNSIREFKSSMYGITFDGYYSISDYCSLSASLGFSSQSSSKYPYSKTTNWYYKYIDVNEKYYFCYGFGATFYPYKRLAVGLTYKKFFGGMLSIGFLF